MIPPVVAATTRSNGEKDIFLRLKEDPQTEGWIVLHSLDIAKHVKQISGEADFVIIVPKKGILCLEVKATTKLRRNPAGAWLYGDSIKPDYTGPFKQANMAMHSIRERVQEANKDLFALLWESAVIFPYVPFTEESIEWHPWQVIDRTNFTKNPISSLIMNVLNESRNHIASKKTAWFHPDSGEPTMMQCEKLAKFLRPNFEVFHPGQTHQAAKKKAADLEAELLYFTEEQFDCLDAIELNDRVALTGPAGTGKTLLAIEAFRRSELRGHKARIVCFNSILGDWLGNAVTSNTPYSGAGTLHKLMVDISGKQRPPDKPASEWFQKELPELAIEALLEDETQSYLVDELIIDEAQDLLKPQYLEFFDLLLKGGLASGK